MKKLVLSLSALFAFGLANAQETTATEGFTKGDTFISGGIGFNSQKTGDVKRNGTYVSPRVAYFVTNNISVGASLSYSHQKDEGSQAGVGAYEQKNNNFSAGVFGRYYFTPANKFSFFAELGAGYTSGKIDTSGYDYNTDYKTNGVFVGLSPAISYFISNHFALEATLGLLNYNSMNPDNNTVIEEESTDSFSVGLNLSNITFGIVYKF